MNASDPADRLDTELWSRRQDRRDVVMAGEVSADDAPLVPLLLALARLCAQRDAACVKALATGNQSICQ